MSSEGTPDGYFEYYRLPASNYVCRHTGSYGEVLYGWEITSLMVWEKHSLKMISNMIKSRMFEPKERKSLGNIDISQ
jgi:hypothetical protein